MLSHEMISASLLGAGDGWSEGPVYHLLVFLAQMRDQLTRYNTQVVLGGTTLLGMSGGLIGTFLVLRKRALAADVVSHSALPGIAIAFLLAERLAPGSGRSSTVLLSGAFVTGLLGMAMTLVIRRWTRIKDDAALAIVLGVFFGLGMALFTVVQRTKTGNAAGLSHFIYGKAATLVVADVWLIAAVSVVVLGLCGGLFKEFSLLCFDEEFAAARGFRTGWLDWLLTSLAVAVTLIGLQSVGLLLVVALLLIPPTAARFWTNDLKLMAALAAVIGGVSCAVGVLLSSMFPKLAAGAVIVLAGSVLFIVSLFCGRVRGLWPRWRDQRHMEHRIGRSDLLRACFEYLEPLLGSDKTDCDALARLVISEEGLQRMRPWTEPRFRRLTQSAERSGLLERTGSGWRLSLNGANEARQATRHHRLWEIYLLTQTDLDPQLVDRGADGIEHVLDAEQIAQLESVLAEQAQQPVPPSPHPIPGAAKTT
jgi:manganese/zinc/iron transport system permease protein